MQRWHVRIRSTVANGSTEWLYVRLCTAKGKQGHLTAFHMITGRAHLVYCFSLRQKGFCSVEELLPIIGPLVLLPVLLLSKGCDDPPACHQSSLRASIPCTNTAA